MKAQTDSTYHVCAVHEKFQGKKAFGYTQPENIMCGTFESEASCPTQAVFYFSMQLFHDKAFAVFIGPQKQQNFFSYESFHIHGICSHVT